MNDKSILQIGRVLAPRRMAAPLQPRHWRQAYMHWSFKSGMSLGRTRSFSRSDVHISFCLRPDLSWRDIQHLTVQTAIPVDLDDSGWAKTASGRLYNPKYGFGKLGGYSLVEAAKVFKNVRPQTSIVTEVQQVHKDIPHDGFKVESVVTITDDDKRKANMSQVEHITVTVNIVHRRRGDVEAFLISPNGIVSQLAAVRPYDTDMGGFQNWTFMTVKHW